MRVRWLHSAQPPSYDPGVGEWVLVGAAAVGAVLVVAGYASVRLHRLRRSVDTAWEQLDLALRRRHALAEDLADAVRALGLRTGLPDRVAEARFVADLPGASSPTEQAVAEHGLDVELDALIEAIDRDERIATEVSVARLRVRLEDSRRRIEAHRRTYDASLSSLADATHRWPGRWVARSGYGEES